MLRASSCSALAELPPLKSEVSPSLKLARLEIGAAAGSASLSFFAALSRLDRFHHCCLGLPGGAPAVSAGINPRSLTNSEPALGDHKRAAGCVRTLKDAQVSLSTGSTEVGSQTL